MAFLLAFAASRAAEAVELKPGGGPPTYSDPVDYWKDVDPDWITGELQGTVLASRITPFELHAVDAENDRELLVHGSLTQEVIRETQTGLLSFHYVFGISDGRDDLDFEGATIGGFGSYSTDVRARSTLGDLPILQRSADGDSIWYRQGESFAHEIIVRTDAPAFAEGGRINISVDWVTTAEYPSATLATFRPVPEPAMGVLAFSGAALLLRRRRPVAVIPPRGAAR